MRYLQSGVSALYSDKLFIFFTVLVFLCIYATSNTNDGPYNEFQLSNRKAKRYSSLQRTNLNIDENLLIERGFTGDEIQNMSVLGKWLLTQNKRNKPKVKYNNEKFLILTWNLNKIKFLRRDDMFDYFTNWRNKENKSVQNCSVTNCQLTFNNSNLPLADAVLFPLHYMEGVSHMPTRERADQRWIFVIDESPVNIFLNIHQDISDYNGIFNWSMTYRMDSDVPVPYGITMKREKLKEDDSLESIMYNTKTKLVAVLNTFCWLDHDERWPYVIKLKQHLQNNMHLIGNCDDTATVMCSNHYKNCGYLKRFKFFLAFEKYNCRERLTTVFWNAYNNYAVPIIRGPSIEECERLLPPNSFIHVDEFPTPLDLANYLMKLNTNDMQYVSYHEWREKYWISYQDGFYKFPSKYYCRICEALNYNSQEPKVYNELKNFWNVTRDCWVKYGAQEAELARAQL